ncbi:MAG: DUF1002 domain-containing protein [Clostridiaceae bacterium]|jgi:uncharacterized protein YpuA (DUF1002 family)|nr:DUF1002 domain-containing protein [Clostridiaceae bacterium]
MKINYKAKKSLTVFASALLALSVIFFPVLYAGQNVSAAGENSQDRVVVLGSGLNNTQRTDTLERLGINPESEITLHTVTGSDAERFIDQSFADSAMISSVIVEFKEEGAGVSTKIVTPENITKVKTYQYSNAAITAGIYDCEITVGSIRSVTGNSALTGVYKAAEIHGIELDRDKMIAGNEELITITVIEDNNANNEEFDSEDFSKALTEIKGQIAELVEKEGRENIAIEQITVIINNVLNNYKINISQSDIDRLAETLEKFKNTLKAEDVDKILEQLESFGEKTWGIALDFIETAKEGGWWNQVVDFFTRIFEAIVKFFTNLFN